MAAPRVTAPAAHFRHDRHLVSIVLAPAQSRDLP
jgi:hypothetical protein